MRRAYPFLIAAVVLVQAGLFVANSSGTYDETVYLHMAEGALQQRDNAEFPSKGVAPLPILLAYSLPVLNNVTDYAPAVLLARASTIALVAVPLALLIYFWMTSLYGPDAGAVAALLSALSPTMVAHGSIATTDACFVLFSLAALWALAHYVERRTLSSFAVLVATGGLVFAAKYSGAALFAVAAVAIAWIDRADGAIAARLGRGGAAAVLMLGAGLLFTWNYHPIEGLRTQLLHQRIGHEAFLFGRRSVAGWWYYQPAALALKSTYAELAALVVTVAGFATVSRARPEVRIWSLTFAVVLALSMISRVNIGVRYVLLLVPLAIMIATARLVYLPRAIAAGAAVAALAVQAAAAVSAAPRHLSYFNGLAGGSMNGYRLLADSNIDWGQDAPAIRQVLASVGAREPVVAYFGSAPLEAYGLHVYQWSVAGAPVKARADWIVISATYLVGVYTGTDPFQPFRAIEPDARPTPALFVYNTARPEVKAALATAIARSP